MMRTRLSGTFLRYRFIFSRTENIIDAPCQTYLPNPVKFVYDAGYLVFSMAGQNMIEIWQDKSHPLGPISTVFPPSTEQEAVVKASAPEYAAARHFYPAAAIPVPSEPQNITMNYPILVAATSSTVYVWNIQTAELMYNLNHEMSCPGLAISQKLIVAFDPQQIRFFSRTDGLLLSWVSPTITNSEKNIARDAQLLPPMYGVGFPGAVLSPQTLFHKRRGWSSSRGRFTLRMNFFCIYISGLIINFRSRNLWMRDDTGDSILQTPDTRRQRHPARDPRGSADIQRLRRREDSRIVRCHRFSVSRSHS